MGKISKKPLPVATITIAPPEPPPQEQQTAGTTTIDKSILCSFWMMGLLNGSVFVIMVDGAKSISGSALAFIANTLPALLMKLSAPYWFHEVGYSSRILASSVLFTIGFCICAFFASGYASTFSKAAGMGYELIGYTMSSLGVGMGEASLLALAGRYDPGRKGKYIAAFSSGGGLAGIFGIFWSTVCIEWFYMSFATSLMLANVLAFLYGFVFFCFLMSDETDSMMVLSVDRPRRVRTTGRVVSQYQAKSEYEGLSNADDDDTAPLRPVSDDEGLELASEKDSTTTDDEEQPQKIDIVKNIHQNENETAEVTPDEENDNGKVTFCQRFCMVLSLWPYTIPLSTVYFAEYAMQSGIWTAIGFPVQIASARERFYDFSMYAYLVAVFLSRSSGTCINSSMCILFAFPLLQVANLGLFAIVAATKVFYNYGLLVLCFIAGLLGGGVYVNAFTRINFDKSPEAKEFALVAASAADTFGILFANVCGLFIQSCLFKVHGINGALVTCPVVV